MHAFPIQPPHHSVPFGIALDGREVSSDQGGISPVEQTGGEAVMLGGHQHLPLVHRRLAEIRAGVADEVPQYVLLQLRLAVRRACRAQFVETGEEGARGVLIPAVNPAVPPSPGPGIRLGRRDLVDQIT